MKHTIIVKTDEDRTLTYNVETYLMDSNFIKFYDVVKDVYRTFPVRNIKQIIEQEKESDEQYDDDTRRFQSTYK